MTHVLELSYMYPSPRHRNSGVFIERMVRDLARRVPVDVISPVPWAPRALWALSARWRGYGLQPRETRCHDVPVHHPRYAQPLGEWSVPLAGVSMALGARAVARRVVEERGSQVIHAHQLLPDGLAAVLLGRSLGLPVVCTLHGNDVTVAPFHDPFARAAARLVARRCRAVIGSNGNLLESLSRIGAPGGPTYLIPYGVDGTQFQALERRAARERLRLPADEPFVLYVGLLVARKGVDVLLEAFARVAARVPRVSLVLVGGSGERDDLRRALESRAAALGCGGRVRFVGPRPHSEMPLWFAAADVFAFASRLEGFPNVVREAIACGTPCVATALPSMTDVVGPECGAVVPVDDAAAFAAALEQALGHVWDRSAIRHRAAAWRWDRNAEDTLDVLTAVVGERRAA
ncbi:MAG TPA: glycosyltransferase [Candidatus Binatus sp.]|nr:glycosyltransferase [Candidatus Binatus sp.]